MIKKRRLAIITTTLLLSALLLIILCLKKANPKPQATDRILIGFSMDSFVEERRMRDRDVFVSTANYLGADVNVQVGDDDPALQEAQILFLLDSGVNVLVVIPIDPDGLGKAMTEAKRRGVPVLAYDRLIRNANADLYLAFNAERAGELQAEAFLAAQGKGSVVLYNGLADDPAASAMREGILKILGPHIDAGDVTIALDYTSQQRRSEEAYAVTEALLDNGTEFNAVLAVDDMAAESVIRALSVRRRVGSVFVAGANADLAACQRIAEGTQSMTVYKPIDQIAGTAAQLAVYLTRGERVTVHNGTWDGSYRVPFYELEPMAVTADNLKETVIKDGFHLEEDVYRNVINK